MNPSKHLFMIWKTADFESKVIKILMIINITCKLLKYSNPMKVV